MLYTGLLKATQDHMGAHRVTYGHNWLHKASHNRMGLHRVTCMGYMHRVTYGYTGLHMATMVCIRL